MKKTVLHGKLGRMVGTVRDVFRGVHKVTKRFGHPPKDKTYPHPGCKEHTEPAEVAVLRPFVVFAQLDGAEFAEGQA